MAKEDSDNSYSMTDEEYTRMRKAEDSSYEYHGEESDETNKENEDDGATLRDENNNYYAYWLIEGEGCNPSYVEEDATTNSPTAGYELEEYNGQNVVRIWRTPQYDTWYKEEEEDGQPYMSLDGAISNVAHFESQCVTYRGTEVETTVETDRGTKKTTRIDWTPEYSDGCLLVPDGTAGINITDSSNGRGADDALVLRFSAIITLSPEIFKFTNYHLIAIPPASRYNVTDSYTQIQNIFAERASDCAAGDTACNNNTRNQGGN